MTFRPIDDLAPGGVVSRAALRAAGWSPARVRRARRSGDLINLRRGWYATRDAAPEVVRAVRVGGVLTCLSALKFHGVWTPHDDRLHVGFSEHGSRHRRRRSSYCRCEPPGRRRAPHRAVDDPKAALAAAAGCLEAEDLVVVMDSLLHRGLLEVRDLAEALAGRGQRVQALVERCAAAESGTETMVRERLRRLTRLPVRSQVQIGDVGRVDLLVGKRLVIEVDSVAHNTSAENYRRDRWRDLRLIERGFVVIRLTYEQVTRGWDEVEQLLISLLARHRPTRHRPRRPWRGYLSRPPASPVVTTSTPAATGWPRAHAHPADVEVVTGPDPGRPPNRPRRGPVSPG